MILAASAAYPFVLLALRTVIYLAWGALFFHFPVREANWLGAVIILVTSILAFAGLGIISTSYLLLFKRGNPARWLIVGASSLLGGIMYPVSVLPGPLQWIARLIPVTYSLEGMRQALLSGATFGATLAVRARAASVCRCPASAFQLDLFLGLAPHQDYRHSHPFVDDQLLATSISMRRNGKACPGIYQTQGFAHDGKNVAGISPPVVGIERIVMGGMNQHL